MPPAALLVIAKEPLPGAAKTRLTPPCSPQQAAALAAAALQDTLDVVAATPAARRVLVFEGDARRWRPTGFEVLAQRGDGLGQRLAAAFQDTAGPALLIGMDTPQLTAELLGGALDALVRADTDAVLGPAEDGGYWGIGFRHCPPGAFDRVPMSCASTARHQAQRLAELGLRVRCQPALRDVDTIDDARCVARQAPQTRFARVLEAI